MAAIVTERPTGTALAAASRASMLQALRAMPGFYIACFIAYNLMEDGQEWLLHGPILSLPIAFRVAAGLGTIVTESLLSLLVVAMGAIATHRFILLDDTRAVCWRVAPRFVYWVLVFFLLEVVLAAAVVFLRWLAPDSGMVTAATIVASLMGVVVFVNSVLIFPAVAVEESVPTWRSRIEVSWSRMVGNFWLFVRAGILVALPYILVFVFVSLSAITLRAIMTGPYKMPNFSFAVGIIGNLIGFPVLMLHAAIASWLYAWAKRGPSSNSPSESLAVDMTGSS